MDPDQQEALRHVVLDILKDADMDNMTEFKVRSLAAQRLGFDLSSSSHKKLVRTIVEDFLSSVADNQDAEQQEGSAQEEEKVRDDEAPQEQKPQPRNYAPSKQAVAKDRGPNGDQLVCQLSNKRNVTIQEWRGKKLISIREFYEKNGEMLPTAKGISLTIEQWEAFKSSVAAIEEAIERLQG